MNTNSFGKAIKNILIGAALGAMATLVVSQKSMGEKLKSTTENTLDNVSSMFKID